MTITSNPRVLFLNQVAGPLAWEMAEDAGRAFGSVALLTGHPDTLKKDGVGGVQVCPAPPYVRGSYRLRILSWIRYLAQAVHWVWRRPSSSLLFLYSNPPILPWIGYLARRLRGQHYLVMVLDIHPDVEIRLGVASERNLIVRAWRWLNRRTYEHADVVMTLGEYMAENLSRQFDPSRTSAGRIEVIHPWVDTDVIRPMAKKDNWFAQEHEQVGKLTVMYSGNMGMAHDIETMLEAAACLREDAEIHFIFVGGGPKWKLVEETIRARGLENVTLLPWQSEEDLPSMLATADVSFVSLEPGMEGLAIPSKAIYALASGAELVVLADRRSELASWTETYACGRVVSPGCADALTDTLRDLKRERPSRAQRARHSADVARNLFARSANTRRILDLIARATGAQVNRRQEARIDAAQ